MHAEIDVAIRDAAHASDELKRNLYTLCDTIGPRFAGTEGDRRAAAFILEKFESYGLSHAHLEDFPFTAWRRGKGACLRLQEPANCELPSYAMPYGAPTDAAGITARWVDVGSGSEAEVAKVAASLKGAFALTDGSSGPRKDIQRRCAAAGAVGVLHGHSSDGMLFKTGSVDDGQESSICAVAIPAETLARLRRSPQSVTLHLVVDCHCEPATTSNVVAEIPGTEKPDEWIILGGHYDSHDISPGAFDNATGVTLVMEVARLLQPYQNQLKRTIHFVAFAAEEMGLLGSHYHARKHHDSLRKTRLMMNCDTPCMGTPHGLAFHKCAAAESYVQKLSEDMGEELRFANRQHNSSDHYPFLREGVLTTGIGGEVGKSRGGAYYHTAADTPDKLHLDELSDTAAFMARAIMRIANDPAWPTLAHDPQ